MLSRIFELKVEFYDVDSMNVVWHGNYIKYMECARCRFLESISCSYKTMKALGYVAPIVKVDIKHIRPLTFEEIFFIEARLLGYENLLQFEYTFRDTKNNKIAIAHTSQAIVQIESKDTCYEMPRELQAYFIDAINKGD